MGGPSAGHCFAVRSFSAVIGSGSGIRCGTRFMGRMDPVPRVEVMFAGNAGGRKG